MQFFFNETEIPFNSSGKSTGLFEGLFEIIRPSTSQFFWGLKICNNLVKASNYTAINIKMVGKIPRDPTSRRLPMRYRLYTRYRSVHTQA